MDRETSEDTRLLYCTTGVLLQKLINDKNMHRFTHIVLDEVIAARLAGRCGLVKSWFHVKIKLF